MSENRPGPVYTTIEAIYRSFYSRELYQDVARNWRGLCLPYLLFILTLYWIPETMNMHRSVSEFIADEGPAFIDQVPTITITKGSVSIKEAMPYVIYDRKEGTPFAIIDTTGATVSLDKSPAHILLTKDRLIVKKDSSETRSLALADVADITVTKKVLYEWIEIMKNLIIAVVFPALLFISFGFHLLQVFLLSLLGGHFAKRFNLQLDSRSLIRLSAVAFTPAVMLETAHALLEIAYPYSSFVSIIIAAGYLYYGVGANSEALSPLSGKAAR